MNIKPNYIVIAILAIIVVVLGVALVNRNPQTQPVSVDTIESSSTVSQSQPSPMRSSAILPKANQSSGGTVAQNSNISILSPFAGNTFVIGQNNIIRWSKEAKIPGSIYLVRASDGVVIGWILTNTDPHQTFYTWDTRDVFVSRSNPAKKNIGTGDYVIKIKFDSALLPEISSQVFSIIYPIEVQIPVYDVHIKDFKFNPGVLGLKKGDKIRFINDDPVDQRILLSSFPAIVISSGKSLVFDASVLSSGGSYTFYSESYPSLVLKVSVAK